MLHFADAAATDSLFGAGAQTGDQLDLSNSNPTITNFVGALRNQISAQISGVSAAHIDIDVITKTTSFRVDYLILNVAMSEANRITAAITANDLAVSVPVAGMTITGAPSAPPTPPTPPAPPAAMCDLLDAPANGLAVTYTNRLEDGVATYACAGDYALRRSESTRTCEMSGGNLEWSGSAPFCARIQFSATRGGNAVADCSVFAGNIDTTANRYADCELQIGDQVTVTVSPDNLGNIIQFAHYDNSDFRFFGSGVRRTFVGADTTAATGSVSIPAAAGGEFWAAIVSTREESPIGASETHLRFTTQIPAPPAAEMCDVAELAGADVVVNPPSGNVASGDTATQTCAAGFTPTAAATRTCTAGSWDATAHSCEDNTAPRFGINSAAQIFPRSPFLGGSGRHGTHVRAGAEIRFTLNLLSAPETFHATDPTPFTYTIQIGSDAAKRFSRSISGGEHPGGDSTIAGLSYSFVAGDNGDITVTLPADAIRDMAGNGNAEATHTFANVFVDTTAPSFRVASADSTTPTAQPITAPATSVFDINATDNGDDGNNDNGVSYAKSTATGAENANASLFSINANTGELTFTAASSAGEYKVAITATDDAGNPNTAYFAVSVADTTAPVFATASTDDANPTAVTITAPAQTVFDINATDAGGGADAGITYAISTAMRGGGEANENHSLFSVDTSGMLTFTAASSAGDYKVAVTATDGATNSATAYFEVTVEAAPVAVDCTDNGTAETAVANVVVMRNSVQIYPDAQLCIGDEISFVAKGTLVTGIAIGLTTDPSCWTVIGDSVSSPSVDRVVSATIPLTCNVSTKLTESTIGKIVRMGDAASDYFIFTKPIAAAP